MERRNHKLARGRSGPGDDLLLLSEFSEEWAGPSWLDSSNDLEIAQSVTRPLSLLQPVTPCEIELPTDSRAPGRRTRWVGRYLLIKRLGGGGQGAVWKALQTEPVVDVVALKMLSPLLGQDPKRVAQLRREAERASRLISPSILPAYDFGIADGIAFLAMPFIEGFTLAEVIRQRRLWIRGRPLAACHPLALLADWEYEERVVRILARIARAMGDAHSAQVVHRDIKPGNILLPKTLNNEVYLCDFGLGRDLDVVTAAQLRDGAGTPVYMAPERLLRSHADEILCDVFSLGVTLFESLTLAQPFSLPAELPRLVWGSYLATLETPYICQIKIGLSADLEAIVARAMARDPGQRYRSARELQRDLERYLAG